MNSRFTKSVLNYLFVILLIASFGCKEAESIVDPEPQEPKSRGDIISSDLVAEFPLDLVNLLFQNLQAQAGTQFNVTPVHAINVYKVVYQTIDAKGEPAEASGLIVYPKGVSNMPMLSVHHGTQTNRANVGSVNVINSPEGILGGTMGYYTVAPDYLGLGESTILHPYQHAKASATTVIDLLRAARKFAEQNNLQINDQLFLSGYSEGGYVTLAAHKEIEANYSDEFTVTASAPMAGSYDLDLTARSVLQQQTYDEPSFLAFLIVAYDDIYGWNRIDEIFQQPYATVVVDLFKDGNKTTAEINGFLTNQLSDLFKPEFVTNFLAGTDAQIKAALFENSLLGWSAKAPIRFFHGDADEFVPYQNAVTAQSDLIANGSQSVELITFPGGTHATSVFPSLEGALVWFESLKTSTVASSSVYLTD